MAQSLEEKRAYGREAMRRWRAKHKKPQRVLLTKEQLRANQKVRMDRWLAANLEHKRALDRQYAANNREKAKQKSRLWYANNKRRAAERQKIYVQNNIDAVRTCQRRHAARKKNAEGKHTAADIAEIRRLQKNCCAYCKEPLGRKAHLDHIIPLSRDGTNWPNNLQWLCASCNLRKNGKDPLEYARSLGLLL